jgi:hypothetical protein
MRKHISTIIAGIIFLTGLSLLLYPTISNFWNSKHQTQAVADYSKQIEKMDDQEKEQALAAAEKYNETLIMNGGRFTPTEEENTLYDSLLDANGTGMMGYITIPEIRCKLPIYHGVEDSVLQVVSDILKVRLFRLEERAHTVYYPDTEDCRVRSCSQTLISWKRGISFFCTFMIRY